jgi:D-glycerate 3-kinase
MSGQGVQVFSSEFPAESWLKKNTTLTASNRDSLAAVLPLLLGQIHTDRKTAIGISGAPGSGKSTLARALIQCISQAGIPACLVSLDDYYFERKHREQLADELHPLFRQRGVPGTHELDRMLADVDQILSGELRGLRLPAFDKSIDDRVPENEWRSLEEAPRIVVFEGWCVGATPQKSTELALPANDMERSLDADGSWRREVLKASQRLYKALHSRLDQLWYIRVPDWNCVIDWRWQQERELAQKNLKSRTEVENFLGCFERIFNHMQDSYPQWADLVMEVDRNHDISLPDQYGKAT